MVGYFLPDAPLHVRKVEDLLYDRLPPTQKNERKKNGPSGGSQSLNRIVM